MTALNIKRALVLAGGGSKGAWEVGVLRGILNNSGPRRWDLIAGSSVGALNAAFLCQYPPGHEMRAVQDLTEMWETIRRRDILRDWPVVGRLQAVWRSSLYDSRPLAKTLHKYVKRSALRASGRELKVVAVRLSDGQARTFCQHDNVIFPAIRASAAIPAALPPVKIEGELYVDGGVREITPLAAALDAGAQLVDVIVPTPVSGTDTWSAPPRALNIAIRAINLMLEEVQRDDLRVSASSTAVVRVWRPDAPLGIDTLDFSPASITKLIEAGELVGAKPGIELSAPWGRVS